MHNWRNYVLSLAVAGVTLLAIEGLLRLLAVESTECYASLAGVELPPCKLHSPYENPEDADRNRTFRDLVVDGQRITVGDLWGVSRYDETLGYVPQENSRSANGWWITDDRGARVASLEPEEDEDATSRVVVIGDSFAVGSRLPFEETWSFVLDQRAEGVEVTNFGMDGYSMAQAYLRYRQIRSRLDHDTVLLMFVPEEDLWRDINVRRDVGAAWTMYWVLPRFAFLDEDFEPVFSPFEEQDGTPPDRSPVIERKLKAHLRSFDRFYLDSRYDEASVPGFFVSGRLLTAVYNEFRLYRLRSSLLQPDSEAVQVSAAIFRQLEREAAAAGKRFVLAVLPTERSLARRSSSFWKRWQRIIDVVCDGLLCIDLAKNMRALPDQEIDRGYDGTHFGPVASRHIAEALVVFIAGLENSEHQ